MFALQMLGKLILAEEKNSRQLSSLRIFCRLDISVYRDASYDDGGFQYVVSEVNRTTSTALFTPYAEPIGTRHSMIRHLAQVLHHATVSKCFRASPPPPPGLEHSD